MQRLESDPGDSLRAMGRSWGWILGFGILTVIAGILTIGHPGNTLFVIALIVGIELFVGGIFRLVLAFTEEGEGHRLAYALLGILSIVVGVFCMRHLFQTVAALTLIIGLFFLITGIMDFFRGLFDKDMPNRGLTILTGVLGFIAGIVVLSNPSASIVTLAWLLGIWLTVYGVLLIIAAFQVKKLAETAAPAVPTVPPAPPPLV